MGDPGVENFLNCHLLAEAFKRVSALELLQLQWSVLVQEFVNREISAAHFDLNFVSFDLDLHLTGTELIDSLTLAHEHNLELLAIWVVVDVLSHFLIERTVFDWNVNRDPCLQVNDVGFECFNFELSIAQVCQQIEGGLV